MRVPVVLISGVDPDAMAATMVGLQFDLPGAVAVRHHIDVDRQVLTRTVSDVTGVVEHQETELEHACVSCAIREDIVPTLERLARTRRWHSIVAHLPVGAEAAHLCNVLTWDTRLARFLRVSAVVTAVSAAHPVHDLLGDDLLAERGWHCSHDDRRGVGEVLASMIEYADAVVVDGEADAVAAGLVQALARPDVPVVVGSAGLTSADLLGRLHQHAHTEEWTSPVRTDALPDVRVEGIWRVDLQSIQPFHPERLLESLDAIGGGPFRTRGCFWLPSRPGRALEWDGAGGQLSIGDHAPWGRRAPFTRIVVTGVGAAPASLRPAFAEMLVRPGEDGSREAPGWQVTEDGFEPWLGPIREVA
ncbi:cobalamin biosynthesis protein CobW [Nocardioides immobilis]|uniref:Cobalamin biosynthesis protein CobW n=1 Tax=Nocardioides immobilis TaxID=2049295 RepID=A0A417Y2D9_9ACTN|nr:GTP-binding protein [Nocardioides immobilis]RHW26727.1 cobalamin biosynthesis protein CobW [Nocardioides immobilis]